MFCFVLMKLTFITENENSLTNVSAKQPIMLQNILLDGTSCPAINKLPRPRGRPPKLSAASPSLNKCTNDLDIKESILPNVTADHHAFKTPPSVTHNMNSCKFFVLI